MNPTELFNQVKDLIAQKDFSAAQQFIDDHKNDLGEYFEQAQGLLSNVQGADGILDKLKGFFGK
ncbi:hypothetical protein ACVR1G_09990 [Streptococcus dentasini]